MISNPLMSLLGNNRGSVNQSPISNMTEMFKQFGEFQKNPTKFLISRNYNIPQDFNGTPQELVQHLVNTNQMSQNQFNELSGLANQMQNIFAHR